MLRSHFSSKRVLLGVALCSLAALEYFWLSHLFERLPADYRQTTHHAAKCRYRATPTAEWSDFELIATRTDETLVSDAGVLKIQGHIDWTTQSGEVTYDHSGLYGVDRESRANLAGFGNHERSGQFLFPPHTQKTTYKIWDPFYTGPHTATFSHVETRGSLELYVFDGKRRFPTIRRASFRCRCAGEIPRVFERHREDLGGAALRVGRRFSRRRCELLR
jgi:hypothetical protein